MKILAVKLLGQINYHKHLAVKIVIGKLLMMSCATLPIAFIGRGSVSSCLFRCFNHQCGPDREESCELISELIN